MNSFSFTSLKKHNLLPQPYSYHVSVYILSKNTYIVWMCVFVKSWMWLCSFIMTAILLCWDKKQDILYWYTDGMLLSNNVVESQQCSYIWIKQFSSGYACNQKIWMKSIDRNSVSVSYGVWYYEHTDSDNS